MRKNAGSVAVLVVLVLDQGIAHDSVWRSVLTTFTVPLSDASGTGSSRTWGPVGGCETWCVVSLNHGTYGTTHPTHAMCFAAKLQRWTATRSTDRIIPPFLDHLCKPGRYTLQ